MIRLPGTLLLLIVVLQLPFAQAGETLLFAGGGDRYDPFDKISKDVLTEAYRRIGVQIRFKSLPPTRALEQSNDGILDGEMHRVAGIEQQFPNLVMLPIPINKIEALAFTVKKEIKITKPEDLKSHVVGIRRGIKFAVEIARGRYIHKVETAEQLFRMLGLWRIDVAISTRTAGLKAIKQLDLKQVMIPATPLDTKNLYHYLHKKHQALIPQLTSVLQQMEQERWIEERYERGMANLLKP